MAKHDLVGYWRDRALAAEARLALLQGALNAAVTPNESPYLLGLEFNATRVIDADEEAAALERSRPLP